MNKSLNQLVLSAAAFAISVASAVAWCMGMAIEVDAPWLRLTVLAINLVLAGGCAALVYRIIQSEHRTVVRYLRSLCHTGETTFAPHAGPPELPARLRRSKWKNVLTEIGSYLTDASSRLEEAELARTASEIRARRTAEHQDRIARILANLSEPVLAVDQYDKLVLANTSAQRLFQLELDESRSERHAVAELVKCERLLDLIGDVRRRHGVNGRNEEIELVAADGQPHWYSVTANQLVQDTDAQDSDQGVVAVLRDISAEKAVQKRNAEFVSSVSHEMKTPLAGIKAYVELLVDGDAEDEETREEFLQVINGQADRLQRLIDNMLNLARIEAGVVKVDRQHHSLNEILEEAFNIVQPAAEQKQITLTSGISPMYLGVLADRDLMLQAVINLLSNAVKYTPEGGRVMLRSRMDDGEVVVEVEDSGVGLSEEDCRRVFERFYRVKKDRDMAQGTGLGLALVQHIVEDVHNGKVRVTSQLGVGSTFSLTFPSVAKLT